MKKKILTTALLISAFSGSAGANINESMNRQFGTMQNFTQPAIIVGQEGGVVSGGAMRMRMPIRSVTPVRITPPSIRAGCGGIDLQGGSLSFPSAQEFVQVARAVAGNVGGYAFKLALTSMCNQCENIMSEIQELNNLFNKSNLDSCQLAQGVVDSFDDRDTTAAESSLRDIGTAWREHFSSDRLEASGQNKNEAPAASMSREDREAAFEGNFIWQALIRSGEVVPGLGQSEQTREIMMSMIGTVVFCAQGVDGCPEKRPGERDGEGVADKRMPVLRLNDLLAGGRRGILDCRDDRCLDIGERQVDLGVSVATEMESAFLRKDGILDRLSAASGSSAALTEQDRQWIALLGPSSQQTINMAVAGQQHRARAEIVIRDASKIVIGSFYANMLLDMIRELRRQIDNETRPGKKAAMDVLLAAEKSIREDQAALGDMVSLDMLLLEFNNRLMLTMGPRIGVINATAAETPPFGG